MLDEGVNFIVRARKDGVGHQKLVRTLSQPRAIGNKLLTLDAVVELGSTRTKVHPQARLVMVTLANGKDLYLFTNRLDLSAEEVLAAYKRRWEIEGFHRLLKDLLGVAHLYSFAWRGIKFLLHVALLLALLLYFSAEAVCGKTLDMLRFLVKELRKSMGIGGIWRRNSSTGPRNMQEQKKKVTNR